MSKRLGQSELFPGLAPSVVRGGARLSDDRIYRYVLWRIWGDGGVCLFVMLNPSTADETQDDATVRRCIGFAEGWGHGGLRVVNLYALRATHPVELGRHPDPVGPDNDRVLAEEAAQAKRIVVAWGNAPKLKGKLADRPAQVLELLQKYAKTGHSPVCLGVTQAGHPVHPVRQPKNAVLVPYEI